MIDCYELPRWTAKCRNCQHNALIVMCKAGVKTLKPGQLGPKSLTRAELY